MKKFSIILPVRNGGEYVKECVHSILSQTLNDFNLIVLDNCSSDGTLDWIQSLNDERIIMYPSSKSLSIEENWARVKDVEKNKFMTLIGHDDVFCKDYLETMNALIQKHPNASLYQSHFQYVDASGNFVRNCQPMDEVQYAHEFLACHMMRTMDSMGTGYMMRSKDYDSIGGMPSHYPNLLFADYELWIRLAAITYKATTQRQCFKYRLAYSTSRITNGIQYQQAFEQYVYFLRDLMQTHVQVKETIDKYASEMLYYYCESLSHRLLKTSPSMRKGFSADDFINKCKAYAELLIPGQDFKPESRKLIKAASMIDSNIITRSFFYWYKMASAKYQ